MLVSRYESVNFGKEPGLTKLERPNHTETEKGCSQFKNNFLAEMSSCSEEGSCLRLIDSCITQLKAQGPSRTCNESKEGQEEDLVCDKVDSDQ